MYNKEGYMKRYEEIWRDIWEKYKRYEEQMKKTGGGETANNNYIIL